MTIQWIISVLDEVLVRGVKSEHINRIKVFDRPLITITIMIDDDEVIMLKSRRERRCGI